MRARYYDPSNGRFASEDPKQNGDNWFTYCGCNSANRVDADGCIYIDFNNLHNLYDILKQCESMADNGLKNSLITYLRQRWSVDLRIADVQRKLATFWTGKADEDKVTDNELRATGEGVAAGGSAISDAENVADALETRAVLDYIAEGCPNTQE